MVKKNLTIFHEIMQIRAATITISNYFHNRFIVLSQLWGLGDFLNIFGFWGAGQQNKTFVDNMLGFRKL